MSPGDTVGGQYAWPGGDNDIGFQFHQLGGQLPKLARALLAAVPCT